LIDEVMVSRPTRQKYVISKTFFKANLFASTEETKSNTTKGTKRKKHKQQT